MPRVKREKSTVTRTVRFDAGLYDKLGKMAWLADTSIARIIRAGARAELARLEEQFKSREED